MSFISYALGLRLRGDRDTYLTFRFIACDPGRKLIQADYRAEVYDGNRRTQDQVSSRL